MRESSKRTKSGWTGTRIPIVGAKLAPPRAHVQAIPRSRFPLVTDQHLPRLTLVRGPAGFGKTTVMQQWHDALLAKGFAVAWVTLDSADNSVTRLSAHLEAAVERASRSTTGTPLTGEGIFERISRRIAEGNEPLILMLDEMEAVTSDEAESLLQGLVRLTSADFFVIAAGRGIPSLGQARLSLEGSLNEITSDKLKFDETEVCALLGARLGSRISTEEAVHLGERLEGWAAGLQFACLALQDKADVAAFVNHAASQGAIADYLREDVFSRLPNDLREFLMTTSLFDVLTADLCWSVTGRLDSAAILAHLEQAGLFLKRVEIDKNVVGYRFQNVFAEFLRGQLSLHGSSFIADIHRAASKWYSDQGLWLEAIDHAVKAGEREKALELLDTVSMDYVSWGYVEVLLTWNSRVTLEEAPRYPYAFASWLWAEVFAGHHSLVTESLAQFHRKLESADALTPLLRDNFTSIEIVNACAADRFEETLVKGVQALPTMHRLNSWETNSIANVLAAAQTACGQLQDARETLNLSRRSAQASDRSINHAYGQIAHSNIAITELRLADAIATLRRALEKAVNERGLYSHAAGLCASSLGEILYETNQVSEAEQVIESRITTVTKVGWPDCALSINLTAARIAVLRQDYSLAGEILGEARAICLDRELPRMTTTLQWEQAHIALLAGDPDECDHLLRQIPPAPESGPMSPVEAMTRDIAPIRLNLLRGDVAGMAPRIVRLMAQAKSVGFRRRWLKLCVLHAVALFLEGRSEASVSAMARALRVGLPAGFIRIFIEEGDVAVGLVREAGVQPDIATRAFAQQLDRLNAAINKTAGGGEGQSIGRPGSPRKQLTPRELEIIDIAARGLTNLEIGQCLSLTEPTVKWHMQKAFRKLGVGNRTEAIFMTRQ